MYPVLSFTDEFGDTLTKIDDDPGSPPDGSTLIQLSEVAAVQGVSEVMLTLIEPAVFLNSNCSDDAVIDDGNCLTINSDEVCELPLDET